MNLYVWFRKVMRLWRYWFVFIILLGVGMAVFGDRVLQRVAGTCPAPPAYRSDVGADLRRKIDQLYELGLLYCYEDPQQVLAALNEPVYWGSDGIESVLFFQPESPGGIEVSDYGFGERANEAVYLPGPVGDSPPPGLVPIEVGQPVDGNDAPEGASFYLRVAGAPSMFDYVVSADITGAARQEQGMTKRNFWRDLDRLVAIVRGRAALTGERRTTLRMRQPILPDRWVNQQERWIAPALASEKGEFDLKALEGARLAAPTLYQTLRGPLGNTVWVAGVVSGTNPALALAPPDGGPLLEPRATSLWRGDMPTVLLMASFEPLPADAVYQARFYGDAGRLTMPEAQAQGESLPRPDHVWECRFPDRRAPDEGG